MIRVSWLSTSNDIITKVCDRNISLLAFTESLSDEEFSSFKERFKYDFQISVEII